MYENRGRSRKLPTVLNQEERTALLKQPNPRYITGQRNKLIMQIMLNLGLRLSEAVNLKWSDVDFLNEEIMIRQGKGKVDRSLPLSDQNWRNGKAGLPQNDKTDMNNWKHRQVERLGKLPEYVFTALNGKQLSPRYIQAMVKRYAEKAEIKKNISPHVLRHTYATDLYRLKKNPVTLKKALGHANLETTMIYVHMVNDDVREMMTTPKEQPKEPEEEIITLKKQDLEKLIDKMIEQKINKNKKRG